MALWRDETALASIYAHEATEVHRVLKVLDTAHSHEFNPLSALIDGLQEGFFSLDGEWRFGEMNRAAEEHFRLDRRTASGVRVHELLPRFSESEIEEHFMHVFASGERTIFEAPSIARPGNIVELTVFPFRDGLGVSFRDVTRTRQSETALRESEARLETATAAARLGIWDWNLQTGEMLYSESAKALHGFAPGEPVTLEMITAATHPEDLPRTLAMATRATDPAIKEHLPFEYRIIRPCDGKIRWMLAYGEAIYTAVSGVEQAARYVGTLQDITAQRQAVEALRDSEARLSLAIDAGRMAVWVYDLATNTLQGSPELNRLYGLPPDVQPTIEEFQSRYYADDQQRVTNAYRNAAEQNARFFEVEYRCIQPDQSARWLLLRAENEVNIAGKPSRVVGVVLDITERRTTEDTLVQSEARLRISEERLALALDSGNDGLWDWNVTTGHVWYSDRWQTMLGYEPGEIEHNIRTWEHLIHSDDIKQARALLTDHFEGRSASYLFEHRLRNKSGTYTWVLGRGRVVARDEEGRPLRIVGTSIDITERKASEQRIAYMARHDALTGLPNRSVFHEHLEQRLGEVRRGRGQTALFCLDLDRFKSVNDTLGHPAGDELLCQIASRLTATVREGDLVVRLGGDEFAIIISHADHTHHVSKLAQRVIDAVGQPVNLGGVLVSVGVSIGIALAPSNADAPGGLFKNADLALYRAKRAARSSYRFYEASMDAAVETRMQLELEMREAVSDCGFALHYQPVLRLADHSIVGFEALMRWPHPTRGMIAPCDFIPLAEETGLIVPLGSWALQEACREAASWPDHLRIAVNVSAVQFQQPGLEESVISALATSGIASHRLMLEITESVLIQDADAVIACLHRLKCIGVRIALDDFGIGYSSLSYLRRFPFDTIKMDRSFISEINNPGAAAIVRAVVGIAMQLGATVTAEGVETNAQLEQVGREGCTDVQGYLVSHPLPAKRAIEFISSSSLVEHAYNRLRETEQTKESCDYAA
jgi:diguanylate cyclase (GGDEF)-like protein/PAS domain S-box-containing protein